MRSGLSAATLERVAELVILGCVVWAVGSLLRSAPRPAGVWRSIFALRPAWRAAASLLVALSIGIAGSVRYAAAAQTTGEDAPGEADRSEGPRGGAPFRHSARPPWARGTAGVARRESIHEAPPLPLSRGSSLDESRPSATLPPPWLRHPPNPSSSAVAAPSQASMPPWPDSNGSYPPRPPSRAGDGIGPSAASSSSSPAAEMAPGKHTYVVRDGDTLWGIAEKVLATDDSARVARYWPRIHRANRDAIGRNPNLIFPGQILLLPPETQRR